MSILHSINPATGVTVQSFETFFDDEVTHKVNQSYTVYQQWSKTSLEMRSALMLKFAELLRKQRHSLQALISEEIGTPLDQAGTEIEKSAYIAEYFAYNCQSMLADRLVDGIGSDARVVFDPLGVVLHIAPWNYPFYLALRPVITALLAGNTVVMKHASNVSRISLALDSLFHEAGFGDAFQSLLISSAQVEAVIRNPHIAMVTIIGSERAGASVASIAGQEIKKTVMELGGSDPFIVLEDADIDAAVKAATYSRLRNCGQSCNAAKRFIVMDGVYDEFVDKLVVAFKETKVGDPSDTTVDMGPMATAKGRDEMRAIVDDALAQGAKLIIGGDFGASDGVDFDFQQGYYYKPTILTHVTRAMKVHTDEVFGPVAPVFRVYSQEEAIEMANDSLYGLGCSLWTQDTTQARAMVRLIEAGNVYINRAVRSDPRLPFGGIKKSGYGREFSEFGLLEFVNIKSVVME